LQPKSACLKVMAALKEAVCKVQIETKPYTDSVAISANWRTYFWEELLDVAKALLREQPFIQGKALTMPDWLALRLLTICARPFFVLYRAGLNLPVHLDDSLCSVDNIDTVGAMQCMMQAILGLQNDIIGWEKDHSKGNRLNAIEVLISQGWTSETAYNSVLKSHNKLLRTFVGLRKEAIQRLKQNPGDSSAELQYIELVTNLGYGMAQWMVGCGRYIPDSTVS
jgi:hypothetical protein